MIVRSASILLCLSTIFVCISLSNSKSVIDASKVNNWAKTLGKDLWGLGEIITKYREIKQRYKIYNAQITSKDPQKLLDEIVINITRMMDRKMDAVTCILKRAEEVAEKYELDDNTIETYSYFNSKSSPTDENYEEDNETLYHTMSLNADTHFYNIPVNTSYSSVHVPTNIYDRVQDIAFAVQWSRDLDEIFKQNYRSDPALSWQYFGSSTGIMRHYPAMSWIGNEVDTFDCRIRTWFIEAATCTKDVVILLDNSGSMTGMRKHIAAFTVKNILDTFSNNDYINLLNFSTTVDFIVPCFKDQLIQATRENIQVFKDAVEGLEANDKSELTQGLTQSLNLLQEYRKRRGCSDSSSDCNQAIMLLTDGVPKNMSETLLKYNFLNNGTSKPVRVFTYLIGKEVTKVEEIMWMSCANRGYYTHIQALEQVAGAVLKYIPVVARPLVLQQEQHPASWTHAYVDRTYNDETDIFINEPYRLLTTVAAPAYDTKLNKNNDSRTAELLGVAATDVPIDDIRKLTSPYRIGVNGYAFVVTNNGYVLWHPALRPMFGKILKENFNSVDFTEVEQLDDELNAREIGDHLLKLRNAFVNGEKGVIRNITLKYHYDNTRRVIRAKYDYYYAPIQNTPFTIGISLPHDYGHFNVEVGDVIQKNKHTGEKLTKYFSGSNWKVHPKWVYCKYHYLEGHEFSTPEAELLHFLKKTYDRNFKWRQQYEPNLKVKSEQVFEDLDEIECGRKTLGDNDYYCDLKLMQTLIFDAQSTYKAFEEPWKFKNGTFDRELFQKYNATLRFVATMSGLTRWEYIYGEQETSNQKEFGDYHARAIDEQWYKSAVLQHQYDKDAFVFSVPFEIEDEQNVLVTGSYAIFPEDGGKEAAGSVVGFQFSHAKLKELFLETIKNSTDLECYLIDHSGYIIVSKGDHTGKFFGEVEGEVMHSMILRNIFINLTVYDYQALCLIDDGSGSAGNMLLKPLDYIAWFFNALLSKLVWAIVETNIYQWWDPYVILGEEVFENDTLPETVEDEGVDDGFDNEGKPIYRSCDKRRTLYFLNQTKFIPENPFPAVINTTCNRPYYLQKVVNSNLLLVVVEPLHTCDRTFNTDEEEILYPTTTYQCKKLNLNNLTRRRLAGCFNEHPLEHEITACGKSVNIYLNVNLRLLQNIFILFVCARYMLYHCIF